MHILRRSLSLRPPIILAQTQHFVVVLNTTLDGRGVSAASTISTGFCFNALTGGGFFLACHETAKHMRFGINTFLFTSPFTNKSTSLFKTFRKWGFDTVELAIEAPDHIDPQYVKDELDKAGLACGSVCAALGPDRDLRGTPEAQANSMTYLKDLIDQMVILALSVADRAGLFGCGARRRGRAG